MRVVFPSIQLRFQGDCVAETPSWVSQPVVLCIVYIKCCITDKKRQFAPSPDCAGPSLWMDNEPCSGTALCFCSVANAAPQNPVALAGAVAAGAGSIPSLTNPFCPGGDNPFLSNPIQIKKPTKPPADLGREAAQMLEPLVMPMTLCRGLCLGQLCVRLG